MYSLPRAASIARNSLSRKLHSVKEGGPGNVSQSELIAATMGWLQPREAVDPEPTTWQAVTDNAFSGTLKGIKILEM